MTYLYLSLDLPATEEARCPGVIRSSLPQKCRGFLAQPVLERLMRREPSHVNAVEGRSRLADLAAMHSRVVRQRFRPWRATSSRIFLSGDISITCQTLSLTGFYTVDTGAISDAIHTEAPYRYLITSDMSTDFIFQQGALDKVFIRRIRPCDFRLRFSKLRLI